jgi:hypothetical protein
MFLTSPGDDISRLYTLDPQCLCDVNFGAARLGWYYA